MEWSSLDDVEEMFLSSFLRSSLSSCLASFCCSLEFFLLLFLFLRSFGDRGALGEEELAEAPEGAEGGEVMATAGIEVADGVAGLAAGTTVEFEL